MMSQSTVGGQTTGGQSSSGVSQSNLFNASYGNPMSGGLVGSNGTITFGQPLYNVSTTGTSTLGGTRSAVGTGSTLNRTGTGLNGSARINTNSLNGNSRNNGMGINGPASYVTAFAGGVPPVGTLPSSQQLRTNLDQVIARSSVVPRLGDVRIVPDLNGQFVLQGTIRAGSAEEAARQKVLLETMLRLQPGVRDLRNDLQVEENTLPNPRPVR
jgi:hypothetical protein